MEQLHIKHQFFSVMDKSKLVKMKIDSTLELLYEYVINESKELCPGLDFASMIELNEVFNLFDTYLSQFKDYIKSPPGKVGKRKNIEFNPGNNVANNIDEARNNVEMNHLHSAVNCNEIIENNNVEVSHLHKAVNHDGMIEKIYVEMNHLQSAVENSNITKENNTDKLVNIINEESIQHADVPKLEQMTSIVSCSPTDSSSYVCKQSGFIIKKEAQMEINGEYKVSIKHIENLNNFHVNIMNHVTKEFLKNWNSMVKFYKDHTNNKEYILQNQDKDSDVFVAVLYNSLWYRAKIITRKEKNMLGLHLIDFGMCIKENVLNCRLLKPEFGFPVVLQNVCLNLDYTPEAQTLFNALVGDAEEDILFDVKCVGIVGGRYHITMKEIGSVGIVINEIIDALKQDSGSGALKQVSDQLPAENIHTAGSIDKALEDFDPMKEDFYSETNDFKINPDNACQATIGYIQNDERRFCKFGKRCRKRACPRLHQELDPQGWTKDKEGALSEPYEREALPLQEMIQIDVSHVESVGEFYAQVEPTCDDGEETLDSLMDYMNEKDNMGNMKKLQTPPAEGQLVIASFKGVFCRGKVTESDPYIALIFFVDFGFRAKIHVKNLRQMEGKYNFLPYQALFCSIKPHLEFVIPRTSEHYSACLHLFKTLILYKNLHCVVLSTTTEPHSVMLFTKEMVNLVDYFNTCCRRIMQAHSDSDTTSESAFSSGHEMRTFQKEELSFIPG